MVEVAVPPLVVTTTLTAPAACAGVVTVIEVAELAVMVPAVPPKVTKVAPLRFVPVMVTDCPAAAGPLVGLMLVIVGASTYV